MISVLLVGESWTSATTHYKGFDFFSAVTHEETGADYLKAALAQDGDIEFHFMPSHIAAEEFPTGMDELKKYDVIILSDIGSNTLLLSRKVFIEGKTQPNRLKLIRQWVQEGGALCMCGGYLSFAGFEAKAKYFRTPIEDVLPVNIYTFDDRVEAPEGGCGSSHHCRCGGRMAGASGLPGDHDQGGRPFHRGNRKRRSFDRRLELRQGPRHGMDHGCWPPLVSHRLRRMGRLWQNLEKRHALAGREINPENAKIPDPNGSGISFYCRSSIPLG